MPQKASADMNPADALTLLPLAQTAVNVLVLALLYLFAARPLFQWMAMLEAGRKPRGRRLPARPESRTAPRILGPTADVPSRRLPAEAAPQQRELEQARQIYAEVCGFVSVNPEKTADLLRAWMKERP